jgi:RNA polymerase sigma-32 factor
MEPGPLTFNHQFRDVRPLPVLSLETEQELCLRWRDHHDISAAHQLAGSHLLLVVKAASAYRGFGLPQEDLIGEGVMGLILAVCRYDPSWSVRRSARLVPRSGCSSVCNVHGTILASSITHTEI